MAIIHNLTEYDIQIPGTPAILITGQNIGIKIAKFNETDGVFFRNLWVCEDTTSPMKKALCALHKYKDSYWILAVSEISDQFDLVAKIKDRIAPMVKLIDLSEDDKVDDAAKESYIYKLVDTCHTRFIDPACEDTRLQDDAFA